MQQPAIASASPPTMWQPASRISNSTNYVAASQPHYGTASPPTTRQPANRIWPYQISLDLTKPYHIMSGCIGLQTSIIPSTFIRSHQIWSNLIKSHQVLLNRSACVFGRSSACFGSVRGSAELHDSGPAVFAQRRHFSRWCWNTDPVPVLEPPRAENWYVLASCLQLPTCAQRPQGRSLVGTPATVPERVTPSQSPIWGTISHPPNFVTKSLMFRSRFRDELNRTLICTYVVTHCA